MFPKSKIIHPALSSEQQLARELPPNVVALRRRNWLEVTLLFAFILLSIWTPQGPLNLLFMLAAAGAVAVFALTGTWGASEMGFRRPLAGAMSMLLAGAVLCGLIALIAIPMRPVGPGYLIPLRKSWQYVIWALQQQFILQSVFFLRLEAMMGSRRAVVATAFLFALVHLPNPILTVLSFFGGILFCEFFRRWRNLIPLGIVHAGLGLTIAASLPDRWLHHMRVGIGYLMVRP
jgi:membrane protease YdiL (CAAX protease family)